MKITTSKTIKDLQQILFLQSANLGKKITKEQAQKEGFVTLEHDLSLLQKMNSPYPHAIAKADEQVVGYALVMLKELRNDVPELIPMFDQIDKVIYKSQSMKDAQYFIMGQICIEKGFRGQGIFQKLYQDLAERLGKEFDFICTEIADRNKPSMKAHRKVGIVEIDRHLDEAGQEWVIVALEI